ncbi:uncharacterized [Tachysurus ichikawai]
MSMLLRKGHGTEPVLCGQELVEVGLGWSSRRGKQDGFFGLEEAFHYESGCLFGSEVVRKVQSEPCRRDLGAEEPLRRLILLNSATLQLPTALKSRRDWRIEDEEEEEEEEVGDVGQT